MPEAVDVGSVLGGRYKVTAYVLASAEKDLVLDGVDQVLNRPVSILVASAGNASQVATSARELATGDRNGSIQVLDLGITDGGTYLVTNRAPAPDMLDLIVKQDPQRDAEAPFVEPFFTDTLGSEIFGGPRSTEPETYDDEYEYEEYEYEEYDDAPRERKSRLSGLTKRFGRNDSSDDTSDLPPVTASPAPRASTHTVPPPPSRRPGGASVGEDDRVEAPEHYDAPRRHDGDRRRSAAVGAAAVGGGAVGGGATAAAATREPERAASRFPLSGRRDDDDHDATDRFAEDDYSDYDDEDAPEGRPFTRVLVGVVMAVLVVMAVVFAVTQLNSFTSSDPVADVGETEQTATEPTAEAPSEAPVTPSAEPTPEAVAPVVTGITRLVPGNPSLDAGNDGTLPLIIDGNPSTFWGNQVYASDTFGGLATNLALVVELQEESTISEVDITQLNGSGGSFTVLVNDQPVLEGAEQIAQGGFTGPTVTLPIPDTADGAPTGQYVIVNFTQLPRLSGIAAQFPFGLRIAEITVS